MMPRKLKKRAAISLAAAAIIALAACGQKGKRAEGLASGTYEFAEALYANPISSTLHIGGGQRYVVDRDRGLFVIVDAESGQAVNEYVFDSARPAEIDEETWAGRFFVPGVIKPPDIKKYKSRLDYAINDVYGIYTMDDEVWLASKRTKKDGLGDFMSIIRIELCDESTEYLSGETGCVMDGIDAPEAVIEAAKAFAAGRLDDSQEDFPAYGYSSWRVEALEHSHTYEDFDGLRLEVYRMNYEFRSEAPENIALVGGMYITEDNWVCPVYPDCTYLIFKREGELLTYLFAMMENDTSPGEETFYGDLKIRLKGLNLTD